MKSLRFSQPHSNAMNETPDQFSVSRRAPQSKFLLVTLRLGIILVLHIILGVACLVMLGFTFLLIEAGDWLLFLSAGAASCAVGVAASGLSAYFSARGGVVRSLLFALPVLLAGVAVLVGPFPRVGLPVIVWCAFGVSMFVASYMGGLAGAVYGKKRRPKTAASGRPWPACFNSLQPLNDHGQMPQEHIGEGRRQ
jgi:hypothetical protein